MKKMLLSSVTVAMKMETRFKWLQIAEQTTNAKINVDKEEEQWKA